MLDPREDEDVDPEEFHLLEVITDSDYAGRRDDRKSTSSFQIYIDGNLIESRVRSQKAIALSSGEAEFVSVVAGCSDGMLIKHLWQEMSGEECKMNVRSDSSAARAMVQRQGIGRVRHLDASLLWAQKEKEKVLSIAAIPTELNCADVGTKSLTKKRLFGLLYMMKVIDSIGERVGREEYKDIEYQYQIKRGTNKLMKGGKDLRVGLLLLMASLDTVAGEPMNYETEPNAYKFEWWALILCALVGALSVMQWLRCMVEKFFENMFTQERRPMRWSMKMKVQRSRGQDMIKKPK